MQNIDDINEVIRHYENLDTTDFPIVEPNVIKKIKQRKLDFLENQKQVFGFENDVAFWLSQQNHDTKQLVNGLIKNLMQTKNHISHHVN